MVGLKQCCVDLNNHIKTKSWFENIGSIMPQPEPFIIFKNNIIFNRKCGQHKYLIEIRNRLANNTSIHTIHKDFKIKHSIITKELDEYIIEIIDPILKEYDINNIIFEHVSGPVEYVRDTKNSNQWLGKFPDTLYIK